MLFETVDKWLVTKFDLGRCNAEGGTGRKSGCVLLEIDGQWSVSKFELESCNEEGGAGRKGVFIEEGASDEGGRKTSSVHRYASF